MGPDRHSGTEMHRSTNDTTGADIAVGQHLVTDGTGGFTYEPAGGSGLAWFNPMDYGATNDGTTDDTAAVNSAIADWNAAGEGVLYFPAGGGFEVTGALTTITASGTVLGDGMGAYDGSSYVSAVLQTSATSDTFTFTGKTVLVHNIGIFNVAGSTPSNGSGIQVSGAFIGQKVDMDSVVVAGFWDCVDRQVGAQWQMTNCWIWGPVRYGVAIQNTVNQDAGDWAISDSYIYADTDNGTAGIRQVGAGGGKITNVKINGHGGALFTDGISVIIPSSTVTVILLLANVSIENVSGDAIDVSTTGTGQFAFITVQSCQVGLYSNNTGRAVKITAAATGGLGTNGGISEVIIDGLVAHTDGTARAAVELTNTDNVVLGTMALSGFNARYTGSGDTNTTDGGGVALSDADPLTVAEVADPGVGTEASRDDHVHPMDFRWEALTDGEDVFVWEGDDLVHEFKEY